MLYYLIFPVAICGIYFLYRYNQSVREHIQENKDMLKLVKQIHQKNKFIHRIFLPERQNMFQKNSFVFHLAVGMNLHNSKSKFFAFGSLNRFCSYLGQHLEMEILVENRLLFIREQMEILWDEKCGSKNNRTPFKNTETGDYFTPFTKFYVFSKMEIRTNGNSGAKSLRFGVKWNSICSRTHCRAITTILRWSMSDLR